MNESNKEKQARFLSDIEPLAHRVYSLCNAYKIPVFMSFGFNEWVDTDSVSKREALKNTDDNLETEESASAGYGRYMLLISNAIKEGEVTSKNVLQNKALLPEFVNAEHIDKRFSRFVNVVNGFNTVAGRGVEELDADAENKYLESISDLDDSEDFDLPEGED